MDWNTVLSTIAIIVFVVLMMRGCGGMTAGGGCGMGSLAVANTTNRQRARRPLTQGGPSRWLSLTR